MQKKILLNAKIGHNFSQAFVVRVRNFRRYLCA